jgi:hypothetical protein
VASAVVNGDLSVHRRQLETGEGGPGIGAQQAPEECVHCAGVARPSGGCDRLLDPPDSICPLRDVVGLQEPGARVEQLKEFGALPVLERGRPRRFNPQLVPSARRFGGLHANDMVSRVHCDDRHVFVAARPGRAVHLDDLCALRVEDGNHDVQAELGDPNPQGLAGLYRDAILMHVFIGHRSRRDSAGLQEGRLRHGVTAHESEAQSRCQVDDRLL